MIKNWMETTDLKTFKNYDPSWLKFRQDRHMTPDRLWLSVDGATSGWHAAVIFVPNQYYRLLCKFAPFHPTRNIAAELNALLLGLENTPSNSKVTVIQDFIGCASWTIGAWNINSEAVLERVTKACKLIEEKNLDINFVHHAGHQNKKKKDRPVCNSDFTYWNVVADELCEAKVEVDRTVNLVG
jgi:hypothetical protein